MLTNKCFNGLVSKYLVDKFTNAPASMPATPVSATYYIYHFIELRTFAYRGTSIWKNFDDDIINAFPSSSSSKL